MKKLLTLALLALAAFSAEGYKVLNKIKVGGTGGWDYLNVDPATQRVYASHGGIVEVVDLKA
ncbi:MAG: YncE family protein, partial [Candidatus Solibacter sp.]